MALLGGEVGGGIVGQCAELIQKHPGDCFNIGETTPMMPKVQTAWLLTAINRVWCRHVGDESGTAFCRWFVLLPEDVCVRGPELYAQKDDDLRPRHPLIIFYTGAWYVQLPLMSMDRPVKRRKHTHMLCHCSGLAGALWTWCQVMARRPYNCRMNNGRDIREFLSVILEGRFHS